MAVAVLPALSLAAAAVVETSSAVNDAQDVSKVLDAAGYGDRPLLFETVDPLRLLEQRDEGRVAQIPHGHDEAALLLPLRAHPYSHVPLARHVPAQPLTCPRRP